MIRGVTDYAFEEFTTEATVPLVPICCKILYFACIRLWLRDDKLECTTIGNERVLMKLIFYMSVLLMAFGAIASADVVNLADPSQMNDSASWGPLGSDNGGSSPVSGFVISTNGVIVAPAPPNGGALYRLDEGNSFNGFFPSGDQLLYEGAVLSGVPGAITISFGSPVSGAGFLAEQNYADDSGSFAISAFASNNALLGSQNVAAGFEDPVFVGLIDNAPEISSITINFTDSSEAIGNGDFVIDTMMLADSPVATPEPSFFLLSGAIVLALGTSRCVRRSRR
jgi:hypothetical protein